ncbi:5-carboxymethyl-2-hydroxymuconate Delta-isomerase [Andreprevotia chitinilytica]|uniref:5-carboxymethyl-2-hydroxymuconate Delta-isomerase n=1 Tax=Andreprevotia chitinilytica TaxID=396808 RepID=UPI00054EF2D3|nr:5-carboxymethyl-2-hydroxymuconate Delta-isomerase [Andreprevotia chitinilytica]
MPHLTLEYTHNLTTLDTQQALMALNQTIMASGQFEEIDIKSRAIPIDTYLVGTSAEARAFIHIKLALLTGRTPQVKRELSESLLQTLKQLSKAPAGLHTQLCVEILDIDRDSYTKHVIA